MKSCAKAMEEQRPLYSRKGQVGGEVNAVVMLIVGVGVAVLILIFVGTLSGTLFTLVEPNINTIGISSVGNETLTAVNSTAVSAAHAAINAGTLTVANRFGTVQLANFTINYDTGQFTLLNNITGQSTTSLNSTAVNLTYNYGNTTISSAVRGSIMSGFNALQQTGSYLPIIVLAVIITLVLGIILVMMNRNGNSGGERGSAL